MIFSITHRISGIIFAASLPFLAFWIGSSYFAPTLFESLSVCSLTLPFIKLVFIFWFFALNHHLLNGLKYFLWTFAKGMESKSSLLNFILHSHHKFNHDSDFCLEHFLVKGSSKWYWQRISAIILVPTSYWFVFFFLNNLESSQAMMLNSLNNLFVKFLMILFFLRCHFSRSTWISDNLPGLL